MMSWFAVQRVILVVSVLLVIELNAGETADGCKTVKLTGHNGTLEYSSNDTTTLCYNFTVSQVSGNVYFLFKDQPALSSVDRIAVYNVDGNTSHLVSNRTLVKPAINYAVVGWANKSQALNSTVLRVVVYVTPSTTNKTVTIGNYSNDSQSCQLIYTTPPAEISVPEYQHSLNTTFTCAYVNMTLPAGSVYMFDKFSFTSRSSKLTLTSVDLAETFSGTELPHDIISPVNISMSVNSLTKDSFTAAKVQATPSCTNAWEVTVAGAVITSKGYPNDYTNNLDCKILLTSSNSTLRLDLTVVDIDLAKDTDYVEVIDGAASRSMDTKSIAYLTALNNYADKDNVMVSSGQNLLISFKTDELGTAKGFHIIANLTDAGNLFYVPSDIVYSTTSNQTEDYIMSLKAPKGSMVEVKPLKSMFHSFTGTVKCYDGPDTNSPLIGSYRTGQDLYPAVSTQHRAVCIVSGFLANDTFNATAAAVMSRMTQLSTADTDSYTLNVPSATSATYEWIVQPTESNHTVIELTINRIAYSGNASNLAISVSSLHNTTYSNITATTLLPYVVRVPKSRALKLSISVDLQSDVAGVAAGTHELSLSAAYTLGYSSVNVTAPSGVITSPHYPQATPALTFQLWKFDLPATMSYQFIFNSKFQLSQGSFLNITGLIGNKTISYFSVTGPTVISPTDLIFNNTQANKPIPVSVTLSTVGQSSSTGISLNYTLMNAGYVSGVKSSPQIVFTAKYPKSLISSYSATWVFSVQRKNHSLVERVQAQVLFQSGTPAVLQLRDGPRSDSPMIILPPIIGKLTDNTQIVNTTSGYLYVSYRYTQSANSTGSPLKIAIAEAVCAESQQCLLVTNATVCMPPSWRCNGLFQCKDGKDELGCTTPPTTKAPAVTKEGAQWWVVALCILAGVALGIICSVLVIVGIMRRRGRGYNRLSELMTPVPT